ncbi:MAG: DUF3173 family protein [Enterococcus italicus]|uniref:DUF3173 family protein n=1 Tax=Enterococcus italicus TaxID=246144 RepID=UPI003991C5EE
MPFQNEAKILMVNKGYPYYNNKRLGVVPRQVVEEIIGIPLLARNEDAKNKISVCVSRQERTLFLSRGTRY